MTSLISRWRVETVFRSLLSIFVVASPICHTHLQESSDLVLIGSNSTGSYRLTGSQIDSADTNLCACLTWLIDSAHAAGFMLAIWQSHWLKMPCIALRGPSSVHRRRCQSEVLHIFLFSYIVSMLLFFFALCVCVLLSKTESMRKSITADNRTVTPALGACVKYWRDPFPSWQDLLHCRFSVDVQTATGDESISVR